MSDLRRAVIKNADMSEEMQQEAVDVATTALSKYGIERDVAAHIKKEFDKKYHPTWHCIVGQSCIAQRRLLHIPHSTYALLIPYTQLDPTEQTGRLHREAGEGQTAAVYDWLAD